MKPFCHNCKIVSKELVYGGGVLISAGAHLHSVIVKIILMLKGPDKSELQKVIS
ncbi:MAG: hypothetical protein LBL61_00020 [Elusimicrobiota bacterium]|nr:hypothetical protein [Elusimicrobiota bacterium]